jgi:transcription factor TFIIIB component B''
MSTLISSATSGKKAAPKAPPRRRPAGPPAPAAKPAPKTVAEQPITNTLTPQPTPASGAALPTPPATQQSPVRQTIETPHVRFAETVATAEPTTRPTSSHQAQPTATPPATQPIVDTTESSSHAVSSGSRAPTPSQAQGGPLEPVLNQDTLPGYTHVRGGTPPPAYSPDFVPPGQDDTTRLDHDTPSGSVPEPTGASRTEEPTPTNPIVQTTVEDTTNVEGGSDPASAATAGTATRPAKRARQTDTTAEESRAKKAPKRSSTRSNATVQAQLENGAVPGPSQTPRRPPVARMMATAQDPTEDATVPDAANAEVQPDDPVAAPKKTPAKRKPRKVKTPARVNEEEPMEGQEREPPAPKAKKPRKPREKAPSKPRKKKVTVGGNGEGETQAATNGDEEESESDPELHEIDPEALSMYTITKQKRYGKTSEREKRMAEIDWDEVKRKRRAEAEGLQTETTQPSNAQQKEQNAVASTEDAEGNAESENQDNATTRAVEGGLGFRVVNGEIVEDEDTLQIDRRAQAQAEIAMQAPVEEENDLTRFHNRTTYMNDRKRDEKDRVPMWKSKSDPWSEDETDRFYEALKNWGTDFMIISQLFPPKTRAQIKKKFNREERLDAERINAALLGKDPVRMDLNAYALAANLDVAEFNKFDSLEHAQSLISESMKDKEEAMRVAVKEAEETERQRAVHEAGKKKGREGAEERRKLSQAKKAMRSKGMVWGTGTLGGFGGGGDDDGAAES